MGSLGDKSRADQIRERLLTGYPDSPLRADVAYYAASSFEGQAKYSEAANQFSAFAIKYPKDKRARDALYNAAVFYAGIGDVQSAAKLRQRYLKLFGKAKGGKSESADIYFSIAKIMNGKSSEAGCTMRNSRNYSLPMIDILMRCGDSL